MKSERNERKPAKKMNANEKYLHQCFCLLKKSENIVIAAKKGEFNDTELRLIGAVLTAKAHGERLISTRLADILGITRSAVSQIVNRLEERGVVKRVADKVDRKIAYIEASEDVLEKYQQEMKIYATFMGNVVKKYGAEKFQALCEMADEFFELLETEKKDASFKKKNK